MHFFCGKRWVPPPVRSPVTRAATLERSAGLYLQINSFLSGFYESSIISFICCRRQSGTFFGAKEPSILNIFLDANPFIQSDDHSKANVVAATFLGVDFSSPEMMSIYRTKKTEENDFKFSPSTRYPQTHTRGFAARLVPICPICWSFCQKASLGKDGRSLPRPAASLIEWLLPQKPNSLTRGGLIEALSVSCPRPLCCSSACLNSIISCRLRIHGIC